MSTITYNSEFRTTSTGIRNTFSQPNVGGMDRALRAGLATVLIVDALHGTGPLGLESVLVMAAVPLIVSAIMAWDPLYAMLKIRTATLRNQTPMLMKKAYRAKANGGINVGAIDRISRALFATALLATPFLWTETIGAAAVAGTIAGIAVMMSALTGWDPMYQLARIRTATLPIETGPQPGITRPVESFELFDEVQGDDADIFQKAA